MSHKVVEIIREIKKLLKEKPDLVVEVCNDLLKVEQDEKARTLLQLVEALAKMRVLSRGRPDRSYHP